MCVDCPGTTRLDKAEVRVYCGQCGTQNNDEAGSCETCGAPLLITAGARSCGSCGSSLGDHDRFCPSCGASAEHAQTLQSFDVTDDFGDLEIDDIDLTDLPDWLQEMAPEAEQPATPTTGDTPTPDDLPDWLKEAEGGSGSSLRSQPAQQATSKSGVEHQPAEQFSLVSDDDLPDWLKALGDEDPTPSEPEPPATQQEPSSTSAVATLFEIPPVHRAWLTQGRRVDPAQVSLAQQEFSPLEAVTISLGPETSSRSIWDTEPIQSVSEASEESPVSDAQVSNLSDRRRIFRISILVAAVIIVLILALVLLQGI